MSSRRAFTLIELLTVIAIVGVLAGLLVPVVGAARNKARATECLSDLRQIGAAAQLYTHEHKGLLPSISHQRDENGESLSWTRTLRDYLGPDFIGRCPAWPEHPARVTYGWNDLLVTADGRGLPFTQCRTPSATLLLAELAPDQTAEHLHFSGAARSITPGYFRSLINVQAHGAAANYLFVDGHARSLSWADAQTRLAASGGAFVKP